MLFVLIVKNNLRYIIGMIKKLLILVLLCKCNFFIPNTVKREVSLVRIDLQVSFAECEEKNIIADKYMEMALKYVSSGELNKAIEYYEKASKEYKTCSDKIIRSYKRIEPHIINIENYMK